MEVTKVDSLSIHFFYKYNELHFLPVLLFHRVMVLDAGKIVEFDSPSKLLQQKGHFYAMVKDAGITREETTVL